MDKYIKSVGRNTNMLLGIVVDDRGLVPDADVQRMKEFGNMIKSTFDKPLASTSGKGNTLTLELKDKEQIAYIVIMEEIKNGERVREYEISGYADGQWTKVAKGSCIGHKRIEPVKGRFTKIKLEILQSESEPIIENLSVY